MNMMTIVCLVFGGTVLLKSYLCDITDWHSCEFNRIPGTGSRSPQPDFMLLTVIAFSTEPVPLIVIGVVYGMLDGRPE